MRGGAGNRNAESSACLGIARPGAATDVSGSCCQDSRLRPMRAPATELYVDRSLAAITQRAALEAILV